MCLKCRHLVSDYDGELDEILEKVSLKNKDKPVQDSSAVPNLQKMNNYDDESENKPRLNDERHSRPPKSSALEDRWPGSSSSIGQSASTNHSSRVQENGPIDSGRRPNGRQEDERGGIGANYYENYKHNDNQESRPPAEEEIKLEADEWKCAHCTVINKVENWTNAYYADCKVCEFRDDDIYNQIQAVKQAEREESYHNVQ